MSDDIPTEAKAGATFAGGYLLKALIDRFFRGGEVWRSEVKVGLSEASKFISKAEVKLESLIADVSALKTSEGKLIERINESGEKRNAKVDALETRLRQAEVELRVQSEQLRIRDGVVSELQARVNAHEATLIEDHP